VSENVLTVKVAAKDWFDMHRRLGMAEGLLIGWLYSGKDTARARAATKAFLEKQVQEHIEADGAPSKVHVEPAKRMEKIDE
jgi:hypothetical protein